MPRETRTSKTRPSATENARSVSPSADRTVREQRDIQQIVDRADATRSRTGSGTTEKARAPRVGARRQPESPMPEQHLEKPGLEADLDPRPRFLAPAYRGSGKLQDKVALITGGDSGIGRAVAVLYAREGADVAIVYLPVEQPDADETSAAVEREGRRCITIAGDVTDMAFCHRAVAQTVDALGALDILVNNAAFQEHARSLEELSPEHFDLTMRTNLYGYFYMVKAALPYLQAGGVIVNSGSVTGLEGSKSLVDYATTKGGIHAFTKSLAKTLLERGIRVNAVAPGPVWTPLNPADKAAKDVATFGADAGMKRPAQPEELSPAYVFLAAPSCSSYITGEVLSVLGGSE